MWSPRNCGERTCGDEDRKSPRGRPSEYTLISQHLAAIDATLQELLVPIRESSGNSTEPKLAEQSLIPDVSGLKGLREKLDSVESIIEARIDRLSMEVSLLNHSFRPPQRSLGLKSNSAAGAPIAAPSLNVDDPSNALDAIMEAVKESVSVQRATQEMVKVQLGNHTQTLEQMKDRMAPFNIPTADKPTKTVVSKVPLPPDDVHSVRSGTRSTASFLSDMDSVCVQEPSMAGPALYQDLVRENTTLSGIVPLEAPSTEDIIDENSLSQTRAGDATSRGVEHIEGVSSTMFQNKIPDESASKRWYVGQWIDKSGSFFNGAIISVGIDTWQPQFKLRGQHRVHLNTHWALDFHQVSQYVSLLEHRPDGVSRRFTAICGPSMTMIVTIQVDSGKPLTWTLTRYNDTSASAQNHPLSLKEYKRRKAELFNTLESSDLWDCKTNLRRVYVIGIFFVLMLSLVGLGLQTEFSLPGRSAPAGMSDALDVVETVSIFIFMIDIGFRAWSDGWKCLRSFWFWFDFDTIVISALYQWIIQKLFIHRAGVNIAFRVLRFLRAFRIIRDLEYFGIATHIDMDHVFRYSIACLSIVIGILLTTYVFACSSVDLIQFSITEYGLETDIYFDGVWNAMVTLICEFVTPVDQEIFAPIIRARPLYVFFFTIIFFVLPVSFMTIVFAMLGDTAMVAIQKANEEKEEMLAYRESHILEEVPLYQLYFQNLEKKDESVLQRAEFASLDSGMLLDEMQDCLAKFKFQSMGEFFDILDSSAEGKLTERQFVTGMLNLRIKELSSVPGETLLLLMHSTRAVKRRDEMLKIMSDTHAQVTQMHHWMRHRNVTYSAAKPIEIPNQEMPKGSPRIWR